MAEHGSADAALAALPEVARAAGVESYRPVAMDLVDTEFEAAERCGARALWYGADDYPDLLAELPDAPPLLWAIGDAALLKKPLIALVGARNASSLGTRMARRLAADLGEAGHVIVSGLARGVDTAAHLGAMETGTVAVFAGGVDVIYPAENAVLGQEIGERGLRLSEQPMHFAPKARHFPARNRIVSGLCQAVVVVEAAAKSGSLITARTALDQGREVFAIPGHPFDARASGANMLIRDGAMLTRSAKDVIEALERPAPRETAGVHIPEAPPERRTLQDMAALHGEILTRLGPSPVAEDQLIRDLMRPAGEVTPILTALELDGRIERRPGGLLAVVPAA
ncbi:DNA-processing protein DprA [Rhodophyticola sp. MJ-SS7]|nr:DNA-processing protein DprA [Rhodophyticola sp. MJ-SS7]MDU8942913.1 DNA-processing protein DprA [Rhodophyticola sp. MJ-SS7]